MPRDNAIVSFFDQFPEFEGVKVQIRGDDGYFDATSMGHAMSKFDGKERKLSRWTRNEFTKRLLERLSLRTGIPISRDSLGSQIWSPNQKFLIDWLPGKGERVWLHPSVAISYAMSVPEFQAEVNLWILDLLTLGTVNPHYLKWTQEEYSRGVQFNRDDIRDMYR